MPKDIFDDFRFLEAILLIVGGFGFLTFWARTRFWLPRYIHALAAVGLTVGVLSVWASPADAPIKQHGLMASVLLALVLPAIIYAFFILHGGQHSAFNRHLSKSAPCPLCKNPVKTLQCAVQGTLSERFADPVCPHCGHPLVTADPSLSEF